MHHLFFSLGTEFLCPIIKLLNAKECSFSTEQVFNGSLPNRVFGEGFRSDLRVLRTHICVNLQ